MCKITRVRSTWRRNWIPKPTPCEAPSINPGKSAITKSRPSSKRTIPKLGTNVVKWYAATFGLAAVTTDNNVDFPTDGKPTNPTSAKTFNSRAMSNSSPGSPFSAISGAGFVDEAKRMLPRPPCATTKRWPCSVKSPITRPVSASVIVVPCGTLIIKSSADFPVIPFVAPLPPGVALKWRL